MSNQSYWYTRAVAVLAEALADARKQGLSDAETRRLCDSRYPFGPREHHPYKMWLKARREVLGAELRPSAGLLAKLSAWEELSS